MCKNKNQYLIDKLDRLVLPDNLKPKNYDIHLTIDEKEFKYIGEEIITIDILKETDKIIIHSIDLEIENNVELDNQISKSIEFNEDDEIAIIKFEKPIKICNDLKLKLKFSGIINDKLKGFYRSKYQVNSIDHWICSTQFEASDARRCIPCFDEPSLKSTFNIKLTINKELTAISNSMELSIIENNDNKTKTYTFESTPIMSTYLIAFVIGDLEYIEGYTKIDKTRVRVYKGKGVLDSGEYALEIGIKAIDFFVDYFGISLPIKKVDHVAIPSFAFYAMENYGCLTYHDIYLLTSDKTTLLNKQQLVDMISHEVSHQWFGNLVTMDWWSQLWLNEGFANFFGYLCTSHLYPEWNMWLQFSQNQVNKALYLDSLTNTHPIEVPVHTAAEISEIFDDISYNKGSSIVKMLEDRLGADKFRKAINHYLNKFSFKNTVTEDLWDSLSLFADEDVDITKFVNSFTKCPGYPVISIIQDSNNTFKLKQKRYTINNQHQDEESSTIWNCFIKYQTNNGNGKFILDKEQDDLVIENDNGTTTTTIIDWIKPNYGQTGYFRFDYSESILKSLEPIIKSKQLPAVDRLGVISDVFYSCKSGGSTTNVSTFMDLIFNSYRDETECDIWNFIVSSLNEIQDLIFDQEYIEKFNKMFIDLLIGISDKLGFDTIDGESSGDRLLRNLVNSKLVLLGYNKLIKESSKRFEKFKIDKSSLKSDITNCVLLSELYNNGSNKNVQEFLLNQFLNTTDIAEKKQYLNVLSYGSPTIELYDNILKFSLTSSSIEPCDISLLWSTNNAQFKLHTWKFFCENFKTIDHIFKDNILYPSLIPQIFCSKLNDQQIAEINQFFINNPAPTADRSIKQELENIKNNTNWFNNSNFNLLNWLNTHTITHK